MKETAKNRERQTKREERGGSVEVVMSSLIIYSCKQNVLKSKSQSSRLKKKKRQASGI